MTDKPRQWRSRTPRVAEAREFLEITRDFTDPKEAIREAISNSLDWGASEIRITIEEDMDRPDEELIIRISDNGMGLNEERLEAFFDLGRTTELMPGRPGEPKPLKIGYKGHGTKTYYNSREIEVYSDSSDCTVVAIMETPHQHLMQDKVPKYRYLIEPKQNAETGVEITIRGYDANRSKQDFAHDVLKDYSLWFTRFGSVEKEFGIEVHEDRVLLLQGLGRDQPERILFGHRFPEENARLGRLMHERPGAWTKVFVKRWQFQNRPIVGHPAKSIDMVFYVEGDEAKRSYNPMIRRTGKTPTYGMYKVEDRYGLWACRDYIPIRRCNEWLGLGKRLETKYHAFVNCQDFRLTANRGDIGNTPIPLLDAIEATVKQIFEEEIIGSREYEEYAFAAGIEQQYQTAEQEKKDFTRRKRRARKKKVCEYEGVHLVEPGMEMGVVALFNQVYALQPSVFPFRVIDYDTKRGYDALVARPVPSDLSRPSLYFIEFKYMLDHRFNHSFDHLCAIICWDCALPDGDKARDIQGKSRELRITPPADESEYTLHMLMSPVAALNIEVFVLKQYLKEKLDIEFRPRSAGD